MTTKTKIAIVTATLVAVIAFAPFQVQYSVNTLLQDKLAAAQEQETVLKAAQHKLEVQLTDQSLELQVLRAGQKSSLAAGTGFATASTRPVVNPRAPSPGVYPNAPRLSALIAAARVNSAESGGVVVIPSADAIRNQYGNLMQKMQFTPAQAEAFVKILADKQDQEAAIMQQNPMKNPQSGKRTDAEIAMALDQHQQQLQPLEQPIEENTAAQLQQLLGSEDNYDYYQTYTNQNKERMVVVNGYADDLDSAGVPALTLDQQEQLVNMVYQDRASANDDSTIQAQQVPQIIQQASAFLSADQVEVLKQAITDMVMPVIHGASG